MALECFASSDLYIALFYKETFLIKFTWWKLCLCYVLGLTIVPAICQLIVLPFCPESPRYLLLVKQQESSARTALMKLRNKTNIYNEFDKMKEEGTTLLAQQKVRL